MPTVSAFKDAGVCQGELCRDNDIHMCRDCAYPVDDTLTKLCCKDCLDHQYEGEEYTAPTYAEVIREASSPRAEDEDHQSEVHENTAQTSTEVMEEDKASSPISKHED